MSDLHLEGGLPNLNSGSVYNELPQCDTAPDYRELMSGFVRSAALCAAAQPRAEEPILEGVQAFLEKNYPVSYTHLDVYKRQVCHCVHSPLTLSTFQDSAQRTHRR